jgi:hypothetical protein
VSPPAVHAAAEKARRVVGLYGDPTITWAIGLVADLHRPVAPTTVQRRVADLVVQYPDLGIAPRVQCVPRDEFDAVLAGHVNRPFDRSGRLLRVTMTDDGTTLAVVAHHGVVDGLGLLSVLGSAVGADAEARARGIGAASARASFTRSAVTRLWEALFFPPSRLAPDVVGCEAGDVIACRSVVALKTSTAAAAAAAVQVMAEWNRVHGQSSARMVVAIGASRRGKPQLRPDRDSAYLRVELGPGSTVEQAREAISRTAPEPDFPLSSRRRASSSMARLLRNRLGSSLLVSNLGQVTNLDSVARLAFYPAAGGAQAASIGVVSTNNTTTVTVRLTRSSFTDVSAETLCREITSRLTGAEAQ